MKCPGAVRPEPQQSYPPNGLAGAQILRANSGQPRTESYKLTTFEALGLSAELQSHIDAVGYDTPTPIQRDAIPMILAGEDIMGLAQTGTGKTAAFGLPLIDRLLADPKPCQPKKTKALILAPTRELVNQIAQNLIGFIRKTPLRVTSVVGGVSINGQIKKLSKGTDILVATPGRLLDLLGREAVHLNQATYLVLDEADQMLDLGFIHDLRKIAALVPKKRQTLLFSATMPRQIEDLARSYLTDPVRVEVAPAGKTADKVTQSVHFMDKNDKISFLTARLKENPEDLSLVFARTKHGAEKLMKKLVAAGISAGSIHGNKSQGQRDRAIKGLKTGSIRVLVATDVAARGIDIPGVSHVYNFDLPEVPEAYVHRIGRTARAGADGEAIALCTDTDYQLLLDIERLIGISIRVAGGEPPAAPVKRPARGNRGNGRPKGQANRGGRRAVKSDGQAGKPGAENKSGNRRPRRRRPQSSSPKAA